MANHHGKLASVKKNDVAIAGINAWNIDDSLDTAESTAFLATSKTHEGGIPGWGGSFEGNCDPANTEQAAIWAALKAGNTLTDMKFFVDATHYYHGDVLITGISRATSITDILKTTVTFLGSGDLDYT